MVQSADNACGLKLKLMLFTKQSEAAITNNGMNPSATTHEVSMLYVTSLMCSICIMYIQYSDVKSHMYIYLFAAVNNII